MNVPPRLRRRIEAQSDLGYRLLGFVDEEWEGIPGFLGSGYEPVLRFRRPV